MKQGVPLHYLDYRMKSGYTTFGMIWPQGKVKKDDSFCLWADQKKVPLQSRVTAYWPDSSVKWTAHCGYIPKGVKQIFIEQDNKEQEPIENGITYSYTEDEIKIDAGMIQATFKKNKKYIIENLVIKGRDSVTKGELIAILEERNESELGEVHQSKTFKSQIDTIELEEYGKLKAVVKLTGSHYNDKLQKQILPFIVRFIFYYQEETVNITHTFLYDGDPDKDFLKGLGIRFSCPMKGEVYNRHIKLGGDYGYFSEALQLLLSWRPKLREGLYEEQLAGKLLQFDSEKEPEIYQAKERITIWDNYHLIQDHASQYTIKKRTGKKSCSYIKCIEGKRSKGVAALSGEDGGIIIGLRDFWQKYPSSLWLDELTSDEAKVTAWIWSPEVEAMDFRHYDTVGHEGPYYEGFDEVGATPYGIANTNEMIIAGFNGTMLEDKVLDSYWQKLNKPPVLVCEPEYYHEQRAFGTWSLKHADTKVKAWLEEQMDLALDFYKKEIETRSWYGLFDYGDVMHTYDKARHCWRYDMGGYAWQNTELVPTLWLWYSFLRTGREDIYTLAEAMSRHCSEVDVYHLGRYKGIGSRHNVIHWGCACKEPRIAMAGHHRIFYYLTGDYRMEDIFDEVKDGDFSTLNIDPLRYFYEKSEMVYPTHARSGPDWSTYCSNWLTQWERKDDSIYKNKILTGIEDIKKAPLQLISGSDYEYDPKSSHLRYIGENAAGGTHLTICMGAAQTWLELADLLQDEEWNKMLADFGVCYFASKEEREKLTKGLIGDREFGLTYMISTMGAYAAKYYKDVVLAKKVWHILIQALICENGLKGFETSKVSPFIQIPCLEEISWISTNFVSQWCLNVINCLELIPEYLPKELEQLIKK